MKLLQFAFAFFAEYLQKKGIQKGVQRELVPFHEIIFGINGQAQSVVYTHYNKQSLIEPSGGTLSDWMLCKYYQHMP